MRGLVVAVALLVLASGCTQAEPAPSQSPTGATTTSASQAPATPTGTSPARGAFKLEPFLQGLESPVHLTHAGDGTGRLFVVEQPGRIRIVQDGILLPKPFLDITTLVQFGGERGLLSVAFLPDYETDGRFIVYYTRKGAGGEVGDVVLARYRVSADPNLADASTAEVILVIGHPDGQANHNGGLAKFGPDNMLYVGVGDGGGANDCCVPEHAPEGNGQNLQTHLGKLLRIDVRGETGYTVPSDNPNLGGKREIWAYGLRNPWRFSFDRATGDLYIADVGQALWEEVNHQARTSKGGENYGWPQWEGTHVFPHPGPGVTGDTKPVAEYSIAGEHCSVTGGYVYRGAKIPALASYYVLGDYCSGNMWTLAKVNGAWSLSDLIDTQYAISSFGEDEAGELYLVHHRGTVHRFDPV